MRWPACLAIVALLALPLSCIAPGDPYARDNPYDLNYGRFLLLWEFYSPGVVKLTWNPPVDSQDGDQAVVFFDDELDGDFVERAVLDIRAGAYIDGANELAPGAERDYLIGVRRNGDPVPGTSNWVRVKR